MGIQPTVTAVFRMTDALVGATGKFGIQLSNFVASVLRARDLEVQVCTIPAKSGTPTVPDAKFTICLIDEDDTSAKPEDLMGLVARGGSEFVATYTISSKADSQTEGLQVRASPQSSEVFTEWFVNVLAEVQKHCPVLPMQKDFRVVKYVPDTESSDKEMVKEVAPRGLFRVRLMDSQLNTHSEYDRPARTLTFDISRCGIQYEVGDHVCIWPKNRSQIVSEALALFGLGADDALKVRKEFVGEGIWGALTTPSESSEEADDGDSCYMTAKYFFEVFSNLQGVATRAFLQKLARLTNDKQLATDSLDLTQQSPYRARLDLGSYSVLEAYKEAIDRVKETSPESLPTAEHFLDIMPPQLPRYYSVISSPLMDSCESCQICVVHVKYPTKNGTEFAGLASTYINTLKAGDEVFLTMRKGFKRYTVVDHPRAVISRESDEESVDFNDDESDEEGLSEPKTPNAADTESSVDESKSEDGMTPSRTPATAASTVAMEEQAGESKANESKMPESKISDSKMPEAKRCALGRTLSAVRRSPSRALMRPQSAPELDSGLSYVCVSLGTGIGLIRGIMQHLYYMKLRNGGLSSNVCLFYGVRHRKFDLMFKKDIKFYFKNKILNNYFISFSHDQEQFITPVNLIQQNQLTLQQFFTGNTHFQHGESNCQDGEASQAPGIYRPIIDRFRFIYCGPAGQPYQNIEKSIIDALNHNHAIHESGTPLGDYIVNAMKQKGNWDVNAFTPRQDFENPFSL